MKININNSTYICLLLSFLAGYFEYVYLFLITILIHECGHMIFAKIINFKFDKVILYPFGGITIYNEDLNVSTNKELFVLLGGITFQLIFLWLLFILYNHSYITEHTFSIIKRINIILVSFNFMPVLPLDGGKLTNIIFDKIFSYRLSNIISIVISIFFICFFIIKNKTIFGVILTLFLIKSIIIEITNLKYKYNKFILERYINDYNFKKTIIVSSIYKFKRDKKHIIDNTLEKTYLRKIFDISSTR